MMTPDDPHRSGTPNSMDQGRRRPIQVHGAQRAPVRIAQMGRRGRGVVAGRRIEPGELVERSPVLIIPHADRAAVDPTIVFTYVFMWEHGTVEEDLYKHEGTPSAARTSSRAPRSAEPTVGSNSRQRVPVGISAARYSRSATARAASAGRPAKRAGLPKA
jgi:hypothetical protein